MVQMPQAHYRNPDAQELMSSTQKGMGPLIENVPTTTLPPEERIKVGAKLEGFSLRKIFQNIMTLFQPILKPVIEPIITVKTTPPIPQPSESDVSTFHSDLKANFSSMPTENLNVDFERTFQKSSIESNGVSSSLNTPSDIKNLDAPKHAISALLEKCQTLDPVGSQQLQMVLADSQTTEAFFQTIKDTKALHQTLFSQIVASTNQKHAAYGLTQLSTLLDDQNLNLTNPTKRYTYSFQDTQVSLAQDFNHPVRSSDGEPVGTVKIQRLFTFKKDSSGNFSLSNAEFSSKTMAPPNTKIPPLSGQLEALNYAETPITHCTRDAFQEKSNTEKIDIMKDRNAKRLIGASGDELARLNRRADNIDALDAFLKKPENKNTSLKLTEGWYGSPPETCPGKSEFNTFEISFENGTKITWELNSSTSLMQSTQKTPGLADEQNISTELQQLTDLAFTQVSQDKLISKARDNAQSSTLSQLDISVRMYQLAKSSPNTYSLTPKEEKELTYLQDIIKQDYKACNTTEEINTCNKKYRSFNKKIVNQFPLFARGLFKGKANTADLKGADKALVKKMNTCKAQAIDQRGQDLLSGPIINEAQGHRGPLMSIITQESKIFVSSASNKKEPNRTGNIHFQDVKSEQGTRTLSSIRHAVINVENPNATQVMVTLPNGEILSAKNIEDLAINQNQFLEDLTGTAIPDTKLTEDRTEEDAKLFYKAFQEQTSVSDFATYCSLRNKACGLLKSALTHYTPDTKGNLTINSVSLLTHTRITHENVYLENQTAAFRILESLTPAEIQLLVPNTPVQSVKINTFNFGVNVGEFVGRGAQRDQNKVAMRNLMKDVGIEIKTFDIKINNAKTPQEKAEIMVKKATIEALQADIKERFEVFNGDLIGKGKGKGWGGQWRADQAYQLTSRIAFMSQLLGQGNTCNCASGKDRTGMHMALSINYADYMQAKMEDHTQRVKESLDTHEGHAPINIRINTNDTLDDIRANQNVDALQARNRSSLMDTGQFKIQEKNTGSMGYKLKGGQTEPFFTELFGLSHDKSASEIRALLTGHGTFNAT